MITSGDTRQIPVPGETVLVGVHVEPDGFVAIGHLHPYRTEVLNVIDGSVGFRANGETVVAGPGQAVVVEPGAAHYWKRE
jgi:quercetin dioxygenase-like cupin family protein